MANPSNELAHSLDMAARRDGSDAPALPRGTVTFLLTDVEGSTRLWESDGETMAIAVARHYELLDAAIALHGGARPVEQGEGDSVVAAFTNASDALATAIDAQRAFGEEPWLEDRPLRVRMAVHTGEAQLRDEGNYFGPTIIRCARLRSIAHGGQILLSDATREQVVDQLTEGSWLLDLGAHRLKDLGRAERAWQLCHTDIGNEFPPLQSLDAVVNNLPVQLTSFVGRTGELAELGHAISRSRLVTLTGAGGCGKTRLALQAAADVVDDYDGGVWWIELAPVAHSDEVMALVAATLNVRQDHDQPLLETLAEHLAKRETLLVLDNCEQVLDAVARLVEALLHAAPSLHVVATSREPLGIAGELGWRVPSLEHATSAQLFIERARQVRPAFAPTPTDLEVIEKICERLDGIPLAIELAAARVRMMNPERIAAALDDRFRLLTGGSRSVMPRQQTLEASVAWSFELLDDNERALLRRLSVFGGGFTLDAAEAVGADETVDEYAILDLVGRLADKSLVQVEHGDSQSRYRLLETIRQYARERLVESGESDATRDRHLDCFMTIAELAAPEIPTAAGPECMARLDEERENLNAALEWADASGASEPLLRMLTALTLYFELRGQLGVGCRWFARALESDGPDSVVRARALWGAAHVALYGHDYATALQRAPEAFAMAQAVGDTWTEARALNTIGYTQLWFDSDGARTTLDRSVVLGREIGDDWAIADGLKMLTITWLIQHRFDGAIPVLQALDEFATEIGNDFFVAWAHTGMASAAHFRGDFDLARQEYTTAIARCRVVGDPSTGGIASSWLADVDTFTGCYDAAAARLQALLDHRPDGDDFDPDEPTLLATATLALNVGDPVAALRSVDPLINLESMFPIPVWNAWALMLRGAAHLALGQDEEAAIALDAAHRFARPPVGNPMLTAGVEYHQAQLAARLGDRAGSEDLHHHALALRAEQGFRPGIVDSLEALALLAIDQESGLEGVRLLAAAQNLRDAMGYARAPSVTAPYEAGLARVHTDLDDESFAAAWADGETLQCDDAVAYARRARGERKRPSMGWGSLTPTEERVVAAVTEGLTNPQIGEKLFIARGTVKVHLGHIFTKLGVSSRAELAAQATRRSLSS